MERNLAEIKTTSSSAASAAWAGSSARSSRTRDLPFVMIDRATSCFKDFRIPHGIALLGDATTTRCCGGGVERARGLVTVAASDADNLYITMSARLLNETLSSWPGPRTKRRRRNLSGRGPTASCRRM